LQSLKTAQWTRKVIDRGKTHESMASNYSAQGNARSFILFLKSPNENDKILFYVVQCPEINIRLVMLDAVFHFKFDNFRILNPNLGML
jgi:hypothetical protein